MLFGLHRVETTQCSFRLIACCGPPCQRSVMSPYRTTNGHRPVFQSPLTVWASKTCQSLHRLFLLLLLLACRCFRHLFCGTATSRRKTPACHWIIGNYYLTSRNRYSSTAYNRRVLDTAVVDYTLQVLFEGQIESYHRVKLLAVTAVQRGDWLHAVSISA